MIDSEAMEAPGEVGALTFNTPLEAGLRALFLLAAGARRSFDLESLIYLDYAMVHSASFGGPPSLHPTTPSQGAQLLVRRALLRDGLELMRSRDLVERRYAKTGIRYKATDVGAHVCDQFSSAYAGLLRDRAAWSVKTLSAHSEQQLRNLFATQVRPVADELFIVGAPPDEGGK